MEGGRPLSDSPQELLVHRSVFAPAETGLGEGTGDGTLRVCTAHVAVDSFA